MPFIYMFYRKVLALQPERYGLTDPKKMYNLAGKWHTVKKECNGEEKRMRKKLFFYD